MRLILGRASHACEVNLRVDLRGTRSLILIAEIKVVEGGHDREIGLDASVGDESMFATTSSGGSGRD
jgi:hypothetical protein